MNLTRTILGHLLINKRGAAEEKVPYCILLLRLYTCCFLKADIDTFKSQYLKKNADKPQNKIQLKAFSIVHQNYIPGRVEKLHKLERCTQ